MIKANPNNYYSPLPSKKEIFQVAQTKELSVSEPSDSSKSIAQDNSDFVPARKPKRKRLYIKKETEEIKTYSIKKSPLVQLHRFSNQKVNLWINPNKVKKVIPKEDRPLVATKFFNAAAVGRLLAHTI